MEHKKEPSNTLIYVSNLPFDTNDEQFRELFKGFNIKTAYVARRKNGKSKGFGFVNLEKESDQNAAIEKLNGKELNSRKLIAKIAFNDDRRNEKGELKEEFKTQQNTSTPSETVLHVSNLEWTVKDEDLKKIFAEFNPKVATVAMRRNGRSKGFGFVEFNNKEDREKALSLDQKTFNERTVTVKPSTGYKGDRQDNNNNNQSRNRRNNRRNNFNNNNNNNSNYRRNNNNSNYNRNRRSRSPTKRSPSGNNSNSNNNNNNNRSYTIERRSEYTIYIKNLPFELDETDLKDVFSEFRPKNANIPRRNGRSKGYGFVEFDNSKDQNDALRALDQSEINGRVVSISISNNRSNSPRRNNNNNNNNYNNNRSPRRRGSRTRRNNNNNNNRRNNVSSEPSKTNVYVSNIPFTIDEKKLGEYFKDFKVNNLTIPKKRNGRSFGYAFIEFASNEDQQKALKLNDSLIDGRKVVVQAAFQRDNNNNNNNQSK